MASKNRVLVGAVLFVSTAILLWLNPTAHELALSSSESRLGVGGKRLLRGRAGSPLFDRLQPDLYYITGGRGAGLSNQAIASFNLLYLSSLTTRIAILPPFHSNRQLGDAPLPELPVSWLFNLSRLQSDLPELRGVLEWNKINGDILDEGGDPFAGKVDESWPEVGCWGGLEKGGMLSFARIKPIWTPYPPFVLPTPASHFLSWAQFTPYLIPQSPFYTRFVSPSNPSPKHKPQIPKGAILPNEQLACIDDMSGSDFGDMGPYDEYSKGLGGWEHVGKFMRFRDELVEQSRVVLRKAFGVEEGGEVPPFITMHIDHGDSRTFCKDQPPRSCWSVAQFAHALATMQNQLAKEGRRVPKNVLVVTDEYEEDFFSEIKERGWKTSFDGEGAESLKLVEAYGGWYTTLIDTVLLSQGDHFIGTEMSTMSMLAGRRTQDWNGGLSHMVGPKDLSLAIGATI